MTLKGIDWSFDKSFSHLCVYEETMPNFVKAKIQNLDEGRKNFRAETDVSKSFLLGVQIKKLIKYFSS